MANVFLKKTASSASDIIVLASGANVYGDLQGQEELVIIPNGENFPTGFVVDQTIEKVTLSGALSDYTFSKSGTTEVLVYKGNVLVATIRPQTDDDVGANGTALTFTSGSVTTTTLHVISPTEIRIGGAGGQALTETPVAYVQDTTIPVFVSLAEANAAENQNLLYTAAATDAGAITYSLTGTDAALLAIAADGKVTLKTGSLDFDASGAQKSYSFNVVATDAAANAATQGVVVTVTNVTSDDDTTAPVMSSAAVATNGLSIVITYSEALTGTVEFADYAVTGATISAAAIGTGADAHKVTLTLSSAVLASAGVSDIVYTATAGTANSIKDAATTPNSAATQTLAVVTNNSTAAAADTTAPTAPTFGLATDSGKNTSDGITNNGAVTVYGVEHDATWEYSVNSGADWTAGTSTNASFELAPGTFAIGTVQVRQTDKAGNVSVTPSSNAAAITVDITSPGEPAFALANDSGTAADDGITNDGAVDVTGLDADAIWDYSTDTGANWTAGTGTSFTLATGTFAQYAVRVRQTDVAGNVTPVAFNGAAITVDATAAAPTFALATDSGTNTSDGITKDGTVTVSGIEAGAAWEYLTDGGTTWTAGTGTSFMLTQGTYATGAVQVRQTDVAGNVSGARSSTAAITVDTYSPFNPDFKLANDTGASASDSITRDGTVNVTKVDADATWEYSTDHGTVWTAGTGTSFTLAAGTFAQGNVQVRQTDVAGNVSGANYSPGAITVDATSPVAPIFELATDSGTDADGITNDGTVNVGDIEAGATWEYLTVGGTTWTAGTGGSFTLTEGSYPAESVQVRQTDVAGNVSDGFINAAAITVVIVTNMPGTQIKAGAGKAETIANITTASNTDADFYYINNLYGASVEEIQTAVADGSAATGAAFYLIADGNGRTWIYSDAEAQTPDNPLVFVGIIRPPSDASESDSMV